MFVCFVELWSSCRRPWQPQRKIMRRRTLAIITPSRLKESVRQNCSLHNSQVLLQFVTFKMLGNKSLPEWNMPFINMPLMKNWRHRSSAVCRMIRRLQISFKWGKLLKSFIYIFSMAVAFLIKKCFYSKLCVMQLVKMFNEAVRII